TSTSDVPPSPEPLANTPYKNNLWPPDLLLRTHRHSPYHNRNTIYTVGPPALPFPQLESVIASMIAASNVAVTRYDITPDARNYLNKYYAPTGDLQIPVVSVHNLWDPLVPFLHEPALAQIAQ